MPFATDRVVRAAPTRAARATGRWPENDSLPTIYCLQPIASADARVLILGSMPGAASLRAGQYYAHPRNAFWTILETLLDLPRDLSYEQRVAALQARYIAVWDVLAACRRRSSLDADIEPRSIRVNDFAQFFATHQAIERVCCNGAAAATLFRRHVVPRLRGNRTLPLVRLPSTSPAHAALTLAAKVEAWRAILQSGSRP
ncbi:MAG: DNA-deoxyinosine glycosylase [Gammaproteobacteria bacterium]|nr:DNA-deoxyinosine glycosylase [Gammaproteobacteria bacterium]